jgi:hypothetical protein
MKIKSAFPVIAMLLLAACGKHASDIEVPEDVLPTATLELSQPSANGVYRNGDTVRFTGRAISTASIHGYDVYIRKANDTTEIFYNHIHDHNDTINIDTYWINDRATALDLEGTIMLYLDHDGHVLKKTIPFKTQ